jgi:hypothetical protein
VLDCVVVIFASSCGDFALAFPLEVEAKICPLGIFKNVRIENRSIGIDAKPPVFGCSLVELFLESFTPFKGASTADCLSSPKDTDAWIARINKRKISVGGWGGSEAKCKFEK